MTRQEITEKFNGIDFNNQRNLLLWAYNNLTGEAACPCYYIHGGIPLDDIKCPVCVYLADNISGELKEQKAAKILQFLRNQTPEKKFDLGGLLN